MDLSAVSPEEDSTGVVQLTSGDVRDLDARWSPDGRTIAFVSNRTGTDQIWLVDAESGALRQLTQGGSDLYPQWSPDGKRLVFESSRSGSSNLWLLSLK